MGEKAGRKLSQEKYFLRCVNHIMQIPIPSMMGNILRRGRKNWSGNEGRENT